MKRFSNIVWGVVLIVVGLIIALNTFEITDIDLFFDGWWTLFIIVPCGIGVISSRDKTGNLIGLAIGVMLLLCCQDVIGADMIFKLIVPVIIIIIGIKLIVSGSGNQNVKEVFDKLTNENIDTPNGFAAFSKQTLNYADEVFEGAELNAVFGGVVCDLRNAVFEEDCAINVSAIFGGVDIFVPENINVKVNSTSIFGGISNKRGKNSKENTVTLYVNGTCLFGGVDIK